VWENWWKIKMKRGHWERLKLKPLRLWVPKITYFIKHVQQYKFTGVECFTRLASDRAIRQAQLSRPPFMLGMAFKNILTFWLFFDIFEGFVRVKCGMLHNGLPLRYLPNEIMNDFPTWRTDICADDKRSNDNQVWLEMFAIRIIQKFDILII